MQNIPVTLRLVKKVITNFVLPKLSGSDCIPVVVVRKFEPKLSCTLVELFSMCLKESYFPILKNVAERSKSENYRLVSLLLWFVKSLKNL